MQRQFLLKLLSGQSIASARNAKDAEGDANYSSC